MDPAAFSEDEDRATGYGIQALPFGEGGQNVFLGLAGTNSTNGKAVIPILDPGKEAFLEMLRWKAGSFEILPSDVPRPRTIFSSYENLLMETAQTIDETFARFAAVLFPALTPDVFWGVTLHLPSGAIDVGLSWQRVLAIVSILVLTWINIRGVKTAAALQGSQDRTIAVGAGVSPSSRFASPISRRRSFGSFCKHS